MIRILHVADVHLGAPLRSFGAGAEDRAERVLQAFRQLPEIAEREHVHVVVMAGDLFDTPRPPERIDAEARETIRRLLELVPAVFLVPGNHDPLVFPATPYGRLPPGAHVFGRPAFGDPVSVETTAGPVHAYGFSYDFAHNPDPIPGFRRADLPGAHVVLMHGAVRDAPHWSGGDSLRLEPEQLAGFSVDYIALGDYHRFRPPEEFAADGSVPACYSGSFAALDHTEAGPRGVVVAEVEPGRAPSVRLLPSGVPPVQAVGDVDVSDCLDDLEAADRVARRVDSGSLPVVTLTGQTEYAVDRGRVEQELGARFSFARVRDRTRYYDSDRLGELSGRDDVVGYVARLGLSRIREASSDEQARLRERALRRALRSMGVV
jgi:DNA repair exonuclease SbcCD nuclease subunit